MNVPEEVQRLLAPVIATLDVELFDVEYSGSVLRVMVEEGTPTPGEGITIDRLAQVNRLISPILDQHDPVPGRYTLEVSSPGLERPLRRASHFARAIGSDVVVKMVPAVVPRRFKGRLTAADIDADIDVASGTITIDASEVDGVELDEPRRHELALADVASARTVFVWGPAPKPGQPRSKKGGPTGPRAATSQPDNTPIPEVCDEQ